MSEAHEKTRIRQLTDAAAHWEHKYANARQYNRNLEERNKELEAQNAALLADVNQDEGYERLKVRVSEIETELAISKGREEGKQLVINQIEAALKEAELQRDSWKRIAESGLGIPQTETDLQHELADWKERALNAERRLQVYSTRVQGKEPTEDELEAFRNHSSTHSSGGAES